MDRTLKYYSQNAVDLARKYESADVSEMQKKIVESFKGKKRLLELGSGSGRDAAFLTSKGFDVTGIDGSNTMVKSAVSLHPELSGKLFFSDFSEYLSMVNEKFDGVYSIATLMHFDKDTVRVLLYKINRVLKPGGVFFFSVSIERDDTSVLGYDTKGRFFLELSESRWILLCEQNGFSIKDISTSSDGLGRDGIRWMSSICVKN